MKTRSTVILRETSNWPTDGIPGLTGLEICVVLTKGCLALISEQDVQEMSGSSWCACLSTKQQVKAARRSPVDEHGKQQRIYMHRWLMKPTADQEVDHRDQHKFFCYKVVDNRRQNLRNVTKSQNHANERPHVGCSSRYKGVCWHKKNEKWLAYIRVNQRRIYLGLFTSEAEAASAYNQAHEQHFPGIAEGMNSI